MMADHTDAVRQALIDRADDLFRQAWGEPDRPAAKQWRAKASTARSMEMAAGKRGLWHDHKAGIGGDVLDFFAIEFCGLSRARDDFGRVVDEAARWCGLSLDQAPDLSALTARAQARQAAQAVEAATDARRVQTLVETMQARAQPLDGTPAATYLASRGIDALPAGWSYLPAVPGAGEHAALVAWAIDDRGRIKGGQRILILPDGTRPNTKVGKPAFGSIGGYPARIPATIEGAPLVICEGPETAASVAQATGFETWAVFGVSGFTSAPAPVDRQVIFCPDRDAIKSPAAVAFERACNAQAARGVDLHIAQAPEPAGSKADLNDTLVRAGADAVVAAIDAAARFISPTAPDLPALRPTMEVGKARARLQTEVREALHRKGVTLIQATLGLGKTRAAIEALPDVFAEADARGVAGAVVISVPAHALGRQVLVDIKKAVHGRSVAQLYGPEAQDPIDPAATVCRQLRQYQERAALLLDTRPLCGSCPFAGDCLHQVSIGARADVYIVSHERLKANKTPLQADQELLATIIDESPLNALVSASRRPVALAALMAAPTKPQPKGKAEKAIFALDKPNVSKKQTGKNQTPTQPQSHDLFPVQAGDMLAFNAHKRKKALNKKSQELQEARRTKESALFAAALKKQADRQKALDALRNKLQATVTAHGLGYLRLADLQDWTEQDARSARNLEYKRKITDEANPEIAHNRTITAAAGVFGEIERSIVDGIAENGRLRIQHGEHGLELVLSGLRPISAAFKVGPVLMLDATAQPDVAAMLAGEPLVHHVDIRATENIRVVQDPSISGAKSHFFSKGKTTGNVAQMRHYIMARARATNGQVAVISNKDIIAALDLPPEILTGHFNALRGLNAMQDIDHLIVIGRTQPPPQAIDRLVAAIWGTPCDGALDHLGTAWRHTLTDGAARMVQGKAATHSDPRGEMVLRMIRDAESMQTIGRPRGVNRSTPVNITVFSDAVLDHPVEIKAMKNDLRIAGVVGPMLDRGVAFLSPSQAARAFPDLYASKQAAAFVLAGISDWAKFSIESLYGKLCPVVEISVPRSRNTTFAIVAPWVSDAETEIRTYLPTASVVTDDIVADADQVTAIAPPAPLPARAVDAGAQPAQVHILHSPGWHEAHRRHRAKADSRGRVALAVDHRIEETGIWIAFHLRELIRALHVTPDHERIAGLLGWPLARVRSDIATLHILGLVDADGALDGPLALRKLVRADCIDSPIMAAFIKTRRQPMRMQA